MLPTINMMNPTSPTPCSSPKVGKNLTSPPLKQVIKLIYAQLHIHKTKKQPPNPNTSLKNNTTYNCLKQLQMEKNLKCAPLKQVMKLVYAQLHINKRKPQRPKS